MKQWIDRVKHLSVIMPDSILNKMEQLCESFYPNECGGILIGEYSDDLSQAEVKKIMVSKNNSGNRMSFLREAKDANNFLKKLWRIASGTKYFIGEWHSHPAGAGYPSSTDDDAMYQVAKTSSCSCKRPVLIILNGGPNVWESDKCWVYLIEGERVELFATTEGVSGVV